MKARLAELFRKARDRYDYPWARITGGSAALHFDSRPTVTDLTLDSYQQVLLASPIAPDVWLACGSVIYWGYITSSASRARSRANLYYTKHPIADAPFVAEVVRHARSHCMSARWGDALATLKPLRQLGQIPFASKIIAYVDPVNAGVYDNRINSFLADSGLAGPMLGRPAIMRGSSGIMQRATVLSRTVQLTYQACCLRLRQLRDQLNVLGVTWQCTEGTVQRWRGVDVERAIFRFAKAEPKRRLKSAPSGAIGRSANDGNRQESLDDGDFIRDLREHCEQHPL